MTSIRARAARGVLCALTVYAVAPVEARQDPRVVAIADIHGALDAFTTILRRAGLVDAANRWNGGKAILVQTGDYLDRGAEVRGVMDLLMSLEREAPRVGGRVHVLLGNHEVMNLLGSPRDVGSAAYGRFVDDASESLRARAYEDYAQLSVTLTRSGGEVPDVYRQSRDAWMAAHPPGWLEYAAALGPKGVYGAWLRRRSIFARAADTLFMHAGLNSEGAPAPRAEDADKRVRAEIQRVDRFRQRLVDAKLALSYFTLDEVLQVAGGQIRAVNAVIAAAKASGVDPDLSGFDVELVREAAEMITIGTWAVLAEQGPMWYRGWAAAPEPSLEAALQALLQRNRVRRLAVGHTPQRDGRITPRLAGRVFLLDTGMLAEVYQGRPSALEIQAGKVAALYPDEVRSLPSLPPP